MIIILMSFIFSKSQIRSCKIPWQQYNPNELVEYKIQIITLLLLMMMMMFCIVLYALFTVQC